LFCQLSVLHLRSNTINQLIMNHETIITNESGDKLKYLVSMFELRDVLTYRVALFICPKGKRKYQEAYDDDSYQFRNLSMS